MISYRKDEIDDLAHAVGRHWGGQACDWRLVLESTPRNASPTLELHVEIALGGFTRITTIPLCKPSGDRLHRAVVPATASHDPSYDDAAVAAVRRDSVQALLAQSTGGDIEPLLGYLRCCGILVLD